MSAMRWTWRPACAVMALLAALAAAPSRGEPPLAVLRSSTFGTEANDNFEGAAVGADGALYLVGNAGLPLGDLPGGVTAVTLGSDAADPRIGCGFVLKLAPDAARILACTQLARGVLHATAVAAARDAVYVGGYATDGLEALLKERPGLIREYPLRGEQKLLAEGGMMAANGLPSDKPDPLEGRPWLGRLGAPCVLRFSADLQTLEGGTYLEGWQQVYDKNRQCGRDRDGKRRGPFQEYFWQPIDICPLPAGGVVVSHDGGYFRILTDADRAAAAGLESAEARDGMLKRLAFYDVADYVSRLSADLSRRAWKTDIHTPPTDIATASRLKNGWNKPHYGNPRVHRMRLDRDGNPWICGWSASATSKEPWWSPFLWRFDPESGTPTRRLYEYDPMAGGENRMGGLVADTAVLSVAAEADGNLLTCLISDGGNTPMWSGPRGAEGGKMLGPVPGPSHRKSVHHFWGQVHRVDGRTFDGLGGAKSGPYAWTIDAAGLPDGHFLALGRVNCPLPYTPDAWWTNSPVANPNAFLRVVGPDYKTAFWSEIPGVRPFELKPIGGDRYLIAGSCTGEAAPVKDGLMADPPGAEDAWFAVVKWAPPRASASVKWQYRVPLEGGDPRRPACAYLWMPPASRTLRGLVIGGEAEFNLSPAVRQTCEDSDLGIVRFEHLLGIFRFWMEGDREAEKLLTALDTLAERTGRPELRRVPWITFGHSTGGIFCRNVAYWKPDRTAGVIHYKSGNFHQKDVQPPAPYSLTGVPMLVINGQYETFGPAGVEQPDPGDGRLDARYGRETQWVYVRSDIRKFRERDPNHLMSLVLDPGGDHFFGLPALWEQAALFIRKTAERRIPARLPPGDGPVTCLPVKVEDGWLTDADLKAPKHAPAAWADYAGDKDDAFWHFDQESADAAVRQHRNLAEPQCIEGPECAWLDEGDGWTFRATARWAEALPDKYCGPLAGLKVGHSDQPLAFRCRPVDPVEQVGPDTFRLNRQTAVAIAVVHPGDAKYRATSRWNHLKPPAVSGAKQTIELAPLADMKPGAGPVPLTATASSGLPVCYEVDYGPVAIEDGRLVVRGVPAVCRYPIECRVTAWQIGRRVEPEVEPAAPVSRIFRVVEP